MKLTTGKTRMRQKGEGINSIDVLGKTDARFTMPIILKKAVSRDENGKNEEAKRNAGPAGKGSVNGIVSILTT